ncbi:MAG: hypothetical protein MUC51_12290 [Anaerolineae bacterium]|jgi:hypothetical protein|nr:hypothetical protein [Anaerolineae bacterium]
MPIFWNVNADVYCDARPCRAKLTVAGDTPRQCVAWIKQAGWLYRKSQDDGHVMVRCPEHREITHDMEAEDGYNNP